MENFDIGAVMARLMSNPELLQGALGLANSLMGSPGAQPRTPAVPDEQFAYRNMDGNAYTVCGDDYCSPEPGALAPAQAPIDHSLLLGALRPYLSPARGEKIDLIINVLKVLNML